MSIKSDISWRVYLTFIGLTVFSLCVIGKIVNTQRMEGKYWKSLADSLSTDYKIIEADRGNIYSEDGRLLATSLPFFEIRMDTRAESVDDDYFNLKVDSLAFCLSAYFKDKSENDYRQMLVSGRKQGERYLLIRRKVSYGDWLALRKMPIFNLGKYKGGLISLQEYRRVNPYRNLALRTIGLSREQVKKIGLEARYDTFLTGNSGRHLMQKIAGNTWMELEDDNAIEPQNGRDVVTTIDVGLQDVAENALLNTLVQNEADHGCVILMEVKTGKIKAMANLGKDENGLYTENFNYAIAEAIEPGSTFKMASCAAMIESGMADTSTMVDLEHGDKVYGKQHMKDHELKENYVTLKRAFEISSNVGISKLTTQFFADKPEQYINYLYSFGLNQRTQIDLDGEALPDLKDTKSKHWNKVVSLPWMSVGYEERITPLQTLCFYNAIANDGKRMKPYLVSEIKEYGKTVKKINPVVMNEKMVSEKTVKKLRTLTEGVVKNGTAKGVLLNKNYSIGGKTGTAQIFQAGSGFNNKGGGTKKFLASFVGYFPADNPMYSCIVVVYNPTKDKGVYYGSQVACPVFKDLADKVYATSTSLHAPLDKKDSTFRPNDKPMAICGLKNDVKEVLFDLNYSFAGNIDAQWVNGQRVNNTYQVSERKVAQNIVPDVTGMSLKDAVFMIENKGWQTKISGKGKVIAQQPEAGSTLEKGAMVTLILNTQTTIKIEKDTTATN